MMDTANIKFNRVVAKNNFKFSDMEELKTAVEKSILGETGLIVAGTENGIVLRFENHKLEQTLRCTPLLTDGREPTAIELATAIRELLDWLREEHKDKVF